MSYLQELLRKLLYRDRDLCCLCLRKIETDRTDLDDEVVLLESNSPKHLKISEIFSSVFGVEIFANISAIEDVCIQCVTTTVNTYKFIKDAKENVQNLTNAVEYLQNIFDHTSESTEGYNALFIGFTSDLSVSGHYYDNITSSINISEVFEKFNFYKKSKKMFGTPTRTFKQEKKKRKENIKNKISIEKMLYDKDDLENIRCKYCFKKFDAIPNLKTHFMRVHAPKMFQCADCPKKFGTLNLLNHHKISSHMENLMCTDCGKVFSNANALKNHEKTHYLQIICPDCGRVYKNRNTFNKHKQNNVCELMGRHSPADAKFTCDYCQKKYTQKMSLRVHIQYEHGNYKSHDCKWCKKKFWCQARLKAHIVKHTKEKKFDCNICKGSFVTKESLLYHTRIHTGERPYPCHLCDGKFLSASRRTAHIRSQHNNLNPIACSICNIKFKSIHYLMKHKKIHSENNQESENNDIMQVEANNSEEENAVSSIQDSNINLEVGNYKTKSKDDKDVKPQIEIDIPSLQQHIKYFLVNEVKDENVYIEVSENVEV